MNKNPKPQMNKKSNTHLKKAESLIINSVGQRPMKNGNTHKTTSPERA